MPRATPSAAQSFLSSVILPILSLYLIPVSLTAVMLCILQDKVRSLLDAAAGRETSAKVEASKGKKGCVIISGGRMAKGLHLARAFKRAGWEVIGVEEEGWGNLCPLRFSSSITHFYLLPLASTSYAAYSARLTSIAKRHRATLFIPVSGAGSSVEDARAADAMYEATAGVCKTFIQDPETMLDLHDKDRFQLLVGRLGMTVPRGKRVESVQEAIDFLEEDEVGAGGEGAGKREPKYVFKCMGLDENRGDMTLFPLKGDDAELSKTRRRLEGLRLRIGKDCPYVFQEYIPGQEWCTHASVTAGRLTSFVTCPSNDMLMTYENATSSPVGRAAEQWTLDLLARMRNDLTPSGRARRMTGHFSFDLIQSTKDGKLYPIECNARVHTACVLLPLDGVAGCYDGFVADGAKEGRRDKGSGESESGGKVNGITHGAPNGHGRSNGDRNHAIEDDELQSAGDPSVLRPLQGTLPRSWIYNNLIMRLLPAIISSAYWLSLIHPSLPACLDSATVGLSSTAQDGQKRPNEKATALALESTLVADDWVPFLVLWHVWWPALVLVRWWNGVRWTRLNASTARIFEA